MVCLFLYLCLPVFQNNAGAQVYTETELERMLSIMINHLPEIENSVINIDEGAPQLQIEIDRDRAANFGLSLSSIALEIRTAMDGDTATTMSTPVMYSLLNSRHDRAKELSD